MREIITLQCPECKNRNYSTTKNKKTTTGRLEFSKFCNTCRKHTDHKETKKSPAGSGSEAFSTSFRITGGVSSTVKLSVSKTELLGSNPSSPASLPGSLFSPGKIHEATSRLRQRYGQDNSSNRTTQHRIAAVEDAAGSPRRVPQRRAQRDAQGDLPVAR